MSEAGRKVAIDCDPGHDDALAIWLAAQHFDVVGITTVHGNQSLEKVTRNALQVLEVAGLDVPVFPGCASPLVQEPVYAPGIHGKSGLDGPTLPEPTKRAESDHAVGFIIRTAREHPGVTLIATGPLTNLAMAIRLEPELRDLVGEISLMGGSATYGNSTAVAEFNIWSDPEAARIVFESGIPLRMVGLNLTRQAEAGPDRVQQLRSIGNRVGDVAADLVEFYGAQVRRLFGLRGASLHDVCAVAWLVDESLIEGRRLHVSVELHGEVTRGMTICDQRHVGGSSVAEGDVTVAGGKTPNALVGMHLDVERFFELLVSALSRY